ncbi:MULTISPECIES: hypothetical protein [Delftia]|jgi:hypothetical protein|nr:MULTISPECIES: hypothetical protein [Delftia]EPD40865.1 hypothetical protein HMPREF9702_03434 [Delftia acidovorans CCUG 15835]
MSGFSVEISARMLGQAELLAQLHGLTGSQAAGAYAKAINDTAFEVRRAMQAEMRAQFDRPTDYILRSPRVKMATAARLSASIAPDYMGGKGIDPQKILRAQGEGGTRRDKRSEVALRRVGILPNGMQTAIPATPYPGSDDGRGNLKGSFLVQLLAYFQAFGEQGYKANMTEKGYKRVHKGTKKAAGRRYFVAYGKARGGARTTAMGEADARTSHLAPGIWAASGTGGADVRPVLMFVKRAHYSVRLQGEAIAKRADAQNYLEKRLRYRVREAAGV